MSVDRSSIWPYRDGEPGEGAPMAGLYEHKRSFGAHWVEMTGAHERVTRPLPYAIGRITARVARVVAR